MKLILRVNGRNKAAYAFVPPTPTLDEGQTVSVALTKNGVAGVLNSIVSPDPRITATKTGASTFDLKYVGPAPIFPAADIAVDLDIDAA